MSRNYGIGSRNMARAGRMVVNRDFHGSFQSKYDIGQRWGYFCQWAAGKGVKKMENVTFELVAEYGRHLQQELEVGDRKSSSSPKNYVSAVNTVMRLATQNQWQIVRPGKDCGIEKRVYIPAESKAMPEAKHQEALNVVGERIACLLELQRTLGLRFKESCLLNARLALLAAKQFGVITLVRGTKGGKRRTVPCRPCAVAALERAAKVQDGDTMIPRGMRYDEFRGICYERSKQACFNFHSERHAYAQQRYTEITGAPAPVHAKWHGPNRRVLTSIPNVMPMLNSGTPKSPEHRRRSIRNGRVGTGFYGWPNS